MQIKLLNFGPPRIFAAVLDDGEEALAALTGFVRAQGLNASQVTAIGGFSRVKLGYFDMERRDYRPIEIDEQVEVLSLLGDVALAGMQPTLHLHAVVGRADGSAWGGHLLEGYVRPTLEVIFTESPAFLQRYRDPATGLALLRLKSG